MNNLLFVLMFVIFPPASAVGQMPQATVIPDVFTTQGACEERYSEVTGDIQKSTPDLNFMAACIPFPAPGAAPDPSLKDD